MSEASISSLKLCELFIGSVLSSNLQAINVTVDKVAKHIICSDERVRENIRLILGAGALDAFISQLTSLLHTPSDSNAIGELKYRLNGQVGKISFYKNGSAAIDWKMVRKE
ncbi:hypothetical protein [Massilia orientalis]|uniref:hypothetical protein n=1 Tax=Massilia orientalis TaxID=3050128 RepID=UPI0037DC29B9